MNSLAEEKLQASLRCLAVGANFLEIGKFDLDSDNQLALEMFSKGITHHGIMLDALFNQPPWIKMVLMKLLQVGIDNGSVKPLTRTVFNENEIEAAFRYMATGKHVGKVLINLKSKEKENENATPIVPYTSSKVPLPR